MNKPTKAPSAVPEKTPHQDHHIIVALRKGEDAHFNKLYLQAWPMIFKYVTENSGTPEDAQDVHQYVAETLWEKAMHGSTDKAGQRTPFLLTSKATTFWCSVARFRWLNKINRETHPMTLTDSHERLFTSEEVADLFSIDQIKEMRKDAFRACLEKLNEGFQALFKLYFEEKSNEEIADILGLTKQSYQVKKNRGIKALTKCIKGNAYYLEMIS